MIKKVFKKIIKRNATFSVIPFDHFDVLNQHQNQNQNQYHQNQNQNQQLRIDNRNASSISPFLETKKNIKFGSKSGTATGTRAASVSGTINNGEDGKKKDFDLNLLTLDDHLEHQFKDLHVTVNHHGNVHQIESLNFIDSINKENLAEEIFFAQHRPLGTSTAAPIGEPSKTVILDIHHDWNSYSLNTNPSQSHQLQVTQSQLDQAILPSHSSTQTPLFLINILKRRRKKMNKHKWKKYRREVRNSTRYNPERSRKKKKLKKRGLVL